MKARIIALGFSTVLLPLETFGGEFDGLLSQPDLGMTEGGGLQGASRGWRLGVGFAPVLGVDVELSGLGVFSNTVMPQPLGGGRSYEYDDGFVRVDSTGNAGGDTWNWGYDNGAQFDPAGGGSMDFSISNGLANGKVEDEDEFAPGVEAFAYYSLGELPALNFGGGPARWGIKATLHYANISMEDSGTTNAGTSQVIDTFQVNGVVSPQAPYAGSFNGPGAILSDSPTRSNGIDPGGAFVRGEREVEVNLLGLTVGPYLELPIGRNLLVSLEAGFSLAIADGDYNFKSATTIAGGGTQTNAGSGSETALLPGVAAGLTAIYQMDEAWSAHGGVRYQYYSPFEIDAGSSEAELDFGGAFIISLGLGYRF